MKTGIATMTLDYGQCPKWLFERMKKLSKSIVLAIVEEFGAEEVLKKFSHPVWFQSLGCVIGFDWNSSGLGTITLGALKEGLRGIEKDLGVFVCGGKGKTSLKTPQQIEDWGMFLGLSMEEIDKLVDASKMSAKVDNTVLQDGFELYHHNLIFTKAGSWAVIQQGMNKIVKRARRYHWHSSKTKDFIQEPHTGIATQARVRPLDLTAKKSQANREISSQMVKDSPKGFLKDMSLVQARKSGQMTLLQMPNLEFHHHPVEYEKFDLKRLRKTILLANQTQPKNFEELIRVKGVGPRTIRALSLVSELIYGAEPSYEDPARYAFAHGGKDGTPYFPKPDEMDLTIEALEQGIKKSQVSYREKQEALIRLNQVMVK